MGHQADVGIDVRQRQQPRMRGGDLFGRKAESVHAGVDLQPDLERARIGVGLEPVDLAAVVDRRFETEAMHLGNIGRFVYARQDHDATGNAGRAQALSVGDAGDAEGVGFVEGAGHAFEPVAVAVGLDHGHDPGRPGQLARAPEVVAQRTEMDGRAGRPAHSKCSV